MYDMFTSFTDPQATDKELTLKSSEYHRFMRAGMKGETFDYNDPGSLQKAVKFYDEDTIDRHQRRKEIDEDRLIDSLLHNDGGDEDRQRTGGMDDANQICVLLLCLPAIVKDGSKGLILGCRHSNRWKANP